MESLMEEIVEGCVCVCITCASACSVFEDYLLSVEQLCVCHYYPDKCNWANGLLLMSWKGHFEFNLALDTHFRIRYIYLLLWHCVCRTDRCNVGLAIAQF